MKGLRARRAGLVVAVVLGIVALAQTPAQQPTFRTEANYVRVDAYPTKDGAPVTDLTQADFDVLENGIPQKIEQFEHVMIRGNLPQELRREPNSVAQSRAQMTDPRARVFVIFLDTGHVDVFGSHNIRQPLIDTLNRLIGENDLVGVMTPEMSALDVTFARRSTTIEGFLARHWTWGDRDKLVPEDPVEKDYQICYIREPGIADEMIARRREKHALDALDDLVTYLRGAREERKAILTITEGWLLYRPSQPLADAKRSAPPSIAINPATGKPAIGDRNFPGAPPASDCDRDRLNLAALDDEQDYRRLLDEANRANASFYPIDPRGLPVFDTPISAPAPLAVDLAMLRQRETSLRTLAENTDGLAMVNSNDLARGFKRIVDDLSSYYLMGFYSNGRLDGKFHALTVRVKRPGISVRARRGYLAATPGAATAAAATRDAATTPAVANAETAAVGSAIAPLAGYMRDEPLRVQVAAGWKTGATPSATLWVEGELGGDVALLAKWREGADATVMITDTAGATLATARVEIPRGSRSFRVALSPSPALTSGDYVVRAGARSGDTATTVPVRDILRIPAPAASTSSGAIFMRRGQTTGNKDVPTADLRFRRSERVRVEIPTLSTTAAGARLLDRTGKLLAVPVTAALRDDTDGSRWRTGEVVLAPLAPGDYVIELSEGNTRMLSAFRVVP
ncbi:MAG: VWA domain-containing protein [Acidobacteria bacterium]|nr:VWA domain-containing protein [Acidobacteriota bacterium]